VIISLPSNVAMFYSHILWDLGEQNHENANFAYDFKDIQMPCVILLKNNELVFRSK